MPRTRVRVAYERLHEWLLREACPRWSALAWDRAGRGGFHERIASPGPMANDARRARVQFRQIYSFARVPALGWTGDTHALVADGLEHVYTRYRRSDGLFRAVLAADGTVIEERALLYDQAFALLALSEAHRALGPRGNCASHAAELFEHVTQRLGGTLGFRTDTDSAEDDALLANPHMHLLEAALAWRSLEDAPRWQHLAEVLVRLALEHWIDPVSGAVREIYQPTARSGTPRSGQIEPGHQFEWAGLLLRFDAQQSRLRDAAQRLTQIGETYGIHEGFVVNVIGEDLVIHDGEARLWPQTERIKTWARVARLTDEPDAWHRAAAAADALLAYLAGLDGLWFDRRSGDGTFVPEPSPASSFYHIIGVIDVLGEVLGCR